MSYLYSELSLMCRCNWSTKLYRKPTDLQPTISAILERGVTFLSYRSATIGKTVFREISASVGGNDVPVGYWCPANLLECYPIETPDHELVKTVAYDDSTDCDVSLLVTEDAIGIYGSWNDKTPSTRAFKKQDLIFSDKECSYNDNGIRRTRYRIKSYESEEAVDATGKWVQFGQGLMIKPTETVEVMRLYSMAEDVATTSVVSGSSRALSDDIVIIPTTGSRLSVYAADKVNEIRVEADKNAINSAEKVDTPTYTDDDSDGDDYYWQNYVAGIESSSQVSRSLGNVPIGRMTFVHGMPFQYTYLTDRRIGATNLYGRDGATINPKTSGDVDMYGRTFAKEIAGNMPIMVLIPGDPEYMTKVNDGSLFGFRTSNNKVKEGFRPFWADLTQDEYDSALDNLLTNYEGEFDYFSFAVNMTKYYNFVNPICRTAAGLMGLGDRTILGKSCKTFDWSQYNQDASQDYNIFAEVIGYGDGISFAFDPLSSISDSLNNSTGESQFASMLNSMQQSMKEVQFLAGQAGLNKQGSMFDTTDFTGTVDTSLFGSGDTLLHRAGAFLTNISKGFNIRFPEIWTDSSHSRSYSVDMHFITPYATAYCKWRYVLVPFFHLFALAAPQAPTSQSVYTRPHLIRAFSLGYFNVENGMIESLEWKRFGDGDMLSQNGVPTQIDVTISFKDLYHVLTMGNTTTPGHLAAFFTNVGLMDLIGTLSGVNTNYLSLGDRVGLYYSAAVGMITNIPNQFMSTIQDRFHRIADRFIYGM